MEEDLLKQQILMKNKYLGIAPIVTPLTVNTTDF